MRTSGAVKAMHPILKQLSGKLGNLYPVLQVSLCSFSPLKGNCIFFINILLAPSFMISGNGVCYAFFKVLLENLDKTVKNTGAHFSGWHCNFVPSLWDFLTKNAFLPWNESHKQDDILNSLSHDKLSRLKKGCGLRCKI